MRMRIEVVSPGKQGAPASGLPYEAAPLAVVDNLQGRLLADRKMASAITLIGAEGYAGSYAAKWDEASPLAGLAYAHTFAGTQAPKDSLPRVTVSAYELDPVNIANGAARLRDMLSWLAFCTVPWTTLGSPPLLRVLFGFVDVYGYLLSFDPQVTEWMIDDAAGHNSGLPYDATFSLSFMREPAGPLVFGIPRRLPSSQAVDGGAGGLGAKKVPTSNPLPSTPLTGGR